MLKIKGSPQPSKNNTIAIFSLPRSGSTWLSELLNEIPRTMKVDEPLYRGKLSFDGNMPKGYGKLKELDTLDFFYYQPIPETAIFPKAEVFFKNLLSLKIANPYLFEETEMLDIPFSENVLFKFCHGCLLLPWLVNKYEISAVVLIRNPYAVVASQLQYYSFSDVLKFDGFQIPDFRYSEVFAKHQSILKDIKHPEEALAALWCINYLAVVNPPELKWHIVFYEDLLMKPNEELDLLFKFLNRPIPETILDRFQTPSVSTSKSNFNTKEHLSSWKNDLKENQIQRIKEIVAKFEITKYGYYSEDQELTVN